MRCNPDFTIRFTDMNNEVRLRKQTEKDLPKVIQNDCKLPKIFDIG